MIFSVPYSFEKQTKEHFPNLYNYTISEKEGKKYLRNITSDGKKEEFGNLVFHGGDGATLEMRQFSENSLINELRQVGFGEIKIYRMILKYGVYWAEPFSQIMAAIKDD